MAIESPSPSGEKSHEILDNAAKQASVEAVSEYRAQIFDSALHVLLNSLEKRPERAMVLSVESRGRLTARATHGIGTDYARETSQRLLERVTRENKPLLLLDARQEGVLRLAGDDTPGELRSVICVPFGEVGDECRGILYADSLTEPARFSYADLALLKKVALKLSRRLKEPPPARTVSTSKLVAELQDDSEALGARIILTLVVLSLILLMVMCVPPVTPLVPSAPHHTVVAPDLSKRPFGLASQFLKDLRGHDFKAARRMLSDTVRKGTTLHELKLAARRLAGSELGDAARRPVKELVRGARGTVTIGSPGNPQSEAWTWNFVLENGKWKLDVPVRDIFR